MIVRGGRRTVTIEAVEPTVTLTLGFADFGRLCARHPEVSRLLVHLLAARVNRLNEALMEALHTPAELAGVTRPTANRVLRRLKSDGVVALERGRVTVTDGSALLLAASGASTRSR